MTVTPIDLFGSFLRLDRDGAANAVRPVFGSDRDSWQMMTFHVETDADVHADHWEMHPEAEEIVSCLSGALRFSLRPAPGEPERAVTLTAGTAIIVPRGHWHRLEVEAPGDLMSVTVPRGSRLEKRTDG